MRVTWLQAVNFESLGAIEPWLLRRGHQIKQISLWQGDELPNVGDFDFLIATGGAFVPTDEHHLPWMNGQLELFRSAIAFDKRVLGICLGAQLLAQAYGSSIRPNDCLEIGWHTVRQTPEGLLHPLMRNLPASFPAFHWHQDQVSPPSGATRLASSDATETQAFAIGHRALGVQFHPEIDPTKAIAFSRNSDAPRDGRHTQGDFEIFSMKENFELQKSVIETILTNLLSS
jgi:GMP synthase-like glutamine amidotransferase